MPLELSGRGPYSPCGASRLSRRRHAGVTARCQARAVTERTDLLVASLGEARCDSPLSDFIGGRRTNEHYVHEDDRVVFHDTVSELANLARAPGDLPSFEPGGPRRRLF